MTCDRCKDTGVTGYRNLKNGTRMALTCRACQREQELPTTTEEGRARARAAWQRNRGVLPIVTPIEGRP